jgi:hypothetical protein
MIGDLGKFEVDKKADVTKDKIRTKVAVNANQIYFIYSVEPPQSDVVKKIMSNPSGKNNKSPQGTPSKNRAAFIQNSKNSSTLISIKNVSSLDMLKPEFNKEDYNLKDFRSKTAIFKKKFTGKKGVFDETVAVASKARETKFQFNKMDQQFDWVMVKKHLNYSLCNCIKYNDYFQYL